MTEMARPSSSSPIESSAQLRTHWYDRPGWRPGRRMATFHVLPGGQPAVTGLARRVQEALFGVPALEPLAGEDLHLTLQGVAFVDELEELALAAVIRQATARLLEIPAFSAVLGPAEVGAEGAWLPALPGGDFARLVAALRRSITDVLGERRLLGDGRIWPHVSIAYANGPGDLALAQTAVAALAGDRAALRVDAVHLIELRRDGHRYAWKVLAELRVGR